MVQTRPLVLLVDSPYKSCRARPLATHHEHVDVNVLDTSDTFFNVNDVIKDLVLSYLHGTTNLHLFRPKSQLKRITFTLITNVIVL
jgi:hypothetical protein